MTHDVDILTFKLSHLGRLVKAKVWSPRVKSKINKRSKASQPRKKRLVRQTWHAFAQTSMFEFCLGGGWTWRWVGYGGIWWDEPLFPRKCLYSLRGKPSLEWKNTVRQLLFQLPLFLAVQLL